MTTIYVTFDQRTGHIIDVGPAAPDEAHKRARQFEAAETTRTEQHAATLAVGAHAVASDTYYKVDVERRVLVAATSENGGVRFSFGQAPR